MIASKEEVKGLQALVEKFNGTPMTVVGDLIVDHYIWGSVDRVSPEAPVVVVLLQDENKRLGGAANVAHNLKNLGAEVRLCGTIGEDNNGNSFLEMLEELGVSGESLVRTPHRPTTVKTRVIAHAQQVVRVDREETSPVDIATEAKLKESFAAALKVSRGAIVSDYAKGVISPAVCSVIRDGFAEGKFGAGKLPILVDPKAPNFSLYEKATVIKPNRKEAEAASGIRIKTRSDAIRAAAVLRQKWDSEMLLITLGELGMVLVSGVNPEEPVVEVDTVAREVFDVSGAGDTVSAVFSLALAAGGSPRQAAILSNYAAGVVIREVGTVAITKAQLLNALQEAE